MKGIYNLIFVQHFGGGKNFLFQLPVNVFINSGTDVFVKTIRGEVKATAVTGNFHVDEQAFIAIVTGANAYLPLKSVTGIAEKVETYKKCDFETNENLPF